MDDDPVIWEIRLNLFHDAFDNFGIDFDTFTDADVEALRDLGDDEAVLWELFEATVEAARRLSQTRGRDAEARS